MRPSSPPRARRGAALVLAMLLTALGAAVAAQMLAPLAAMIERERRASDLHAIYTLADGAAAWALTVLAADRLRGPVDHYGEPWATKLPPTPIEGGSLEGQLIDLQAFFNLNSLVRQGVRQELAVQAAGRVFERYGIKPELAQVLADALDQDPVTIDGQSERQRYGRELPNRPLADLSDLRLVPGFAEEEIARLAGKVVVLPADTPVNANTADAALLAALLPGLDAERLTRFLAERETRPAQNIAELSLRLGMSANEAILGTGSQYFGAEARIRHGELVHRLQLQIHRPLTARPTILKRLLTHA